MAVAAFPACSTNVSHGAEIEQKRHGAFIHGKESGPGSSKLAALSSVASTAGWQTCSLDYSHTTDPAVRLAHLVTACSGKDELLLLVGSSMDGWVAAQAAQFLGARGVFLLAPAMYMSGYPSQTPVVPREHTETVHGWDDNVVPYGNAVRFARSNQCTPHLEQDDHRLSACVPLLCELFGTFVARCTWQGANCSTRSCCRNA